MKSRKLRRIKYTNQSVLRANVSANETVSSFGICTKHGLLGSRRGTVEISKTVLTENANKLHSSAADGMNQSNSEKDLPTNTEEQFKGTSKHLKFSRIPECDFLLENSGLDKVGVETVLLDATQRDEMNNLLTLNADTDLGAKYRTKFVEKSDSKAFFYSSVKLKKDIVIPSNLSEVSLIGVIIIYN